MTKFYLDTHADRRGDCLIRVAASTPDGRRLLTSIGYGIHPAAWDAAKMQVKLTLNKKPVVNGKGIPAATINARIAEVLAAFSKLEITPGALTIDALKGELARIIGKEGRAPRSPRPKGSTSAIGTSTAAIAKPHRQKSAGEVLDALDLFAVEEGRSRQWTTGTLECWHAFRQHIKSFDAGLKFADFNEQTLTSFLNYLRTKGGASMKLARARDAVEEAEASGDTKELEKAAARLRDVELELLDTPDQGLQENTVRKHFSNLKWFLRWAIRKGICKEDAILKYRPKYKEIRKPVIYLTHPELQKLYTFEVPAAGTEVKLTDMNGNEYTKKVELAGALSRARDLFCFCAWSSLRYSDMAALRRSDIHGDFIEITTQKTYDRLRIPLNNHTREILDKYKDYCDPRGLALPVISNQKMNDYLKEICELCGFNEPVTQTYYRGGERVEDTRPKWALITTHAARRSFVCLALGLGISPNVVMKFTGHSDYNAMKPYIAIAEADAFDAMKKMND